MIICQQKLILLQYVGVRWFAFGPRMMVAVLLTSHPKCFSVWRREHLTVVKPANGGSCLLYLGYEEVRGLLERKNSKIFNYIASFWRLQVFNSLESDQNCFLRFGISLTWWPMHGRLTGHLLKSKPFHRYFFELQLRNHRNHSGCRTSTTLQLSWCFVSPLPWGKYLRANSIDY